MPRKKKKAKIKYLEKVYDCKVSFDFRTLQKTETGWSIYAMLDMTTFKNTNDEA